MATINLRFAFEKETKGAVRFQEVSEDGKPAFAPSIGTLYIRKSALPDGKIALRAFGGSRSSVRGVGRLEKSSSNVRKFGQDIVHERTRLMADRGKHVDYRFNGQLAFVLYLWLSAAHRACLGARSP